MRILIRNNKAKEWRFAESVKAKAETELQRLLVESPSLIPVGEIREGVSSLVFAVSEFGLPGSGNTDILAFTANGAISIIECKLAVKPESKRKIIGQIKEANIGEISGVVEALEELPTQYGRRADEVFENLVIRNPSFHEAREKWKKRILR